MQIFRKFFLLCGCLSLSFSLLGASEHEKQHNLNLRNPTAWTFKETASAATILSLGVLSLYEASVTSFYGDYSNYPPIFPTSLRIKGALLVPVVVFIGVFSFSKYSQLWVKNGNYSALPCSVHKVSHF